MIKFFYHLLGNESIQNKGARREVGIVPILTVEYLIDFPSKQR